MDLACLTCGPILNIKEHYSSEWHHYNVKRKVAGLPPLLENIFLDKLQQYSKAASSNKDDDLYCSICHKKFQSTKSFESHLNSKRHRGEVNKAEVTGNNEFGPALLKEEDIQKSCIKDSIDDGDSRVDQACAVPDNTCLFCSTSFEDFDKTIGHMSSSHGFYIPDYQFCVDLPGLVGYLALKIGEGRTCIRCNSSRFRDLNSLQKHMRDSNHCNIKIDDTEDGLLEFMDFYDYSEVHDKEEDTPEIMLYQDGFFLTLPSGARIGHRSLMQYFKQSLKPISSQPFLNQSNKKGPRMKQLSWTGLPIGPLSIKHARDVAFMKRTIQNYRLKQGMANNKSFVSKGRKDQQ